jgi:hypothetical protein
MDPNHVLDTNKYHIVIGGALVQKDIAVVIIGTEVVRDIAQNVLPMDVYPLATKMDHVIVGVKHHVNQDHQFQHGSVNYMRFLQVFP